MERSEGLLQQVCTCCPERVPDLHLPLSASFPSFGTLWLLIECSLFPAQHMCMCGILWKGPRGAVEESEDPVHPWKDEIQAQ